MDVYTELGDMNDMSGWEDCHFNELVIVEKGDGWQLFKHPGGGELRYSTQVRDEAGLKNLAEKHPDIAKGIREAQDANAIEYRGYLDGPVDDGPGWHIQREPFELKIDSLAGLKDLNRYHPRLVRRVTLDKSITDMRKEVGPTAELSVYSVELEKMWNGLFDGITAFQKAMTEGDEREAVEAARQIITCHHEYGQKFKEEYLRCTKEMEKDPTNYTRFLLAAVNLAQHHGARWICEFGVPLVSPDDEVKAILADRVMRPLAVWGMASLRRGFVTQLRPGERLNKP